MPGLGEEKRNRHCGLIPPAIPVHPHLNLSTSATEHLRRRKLTVDGTRLSHIWLV